MTRLRTRAYDGSIFETRLALVGPGPEKELVTTKDDERYWDRPYTPPVDDHPDDETHAQEAVSQFHRGVLRYYMESTSTARIATPS